MNLKDLNSKTGYHIKTFGSSLIALLAISAGLSLGTNTVHADNAEMNDLPKATSGQSNKYAGGYAFSAKVKTGITKVTPFGGNPEDWGTAKTTTEGPDHHWFTFQLSAGNGKDGQTNNNKTNNNKWKGKDGLLPKTGHFILKNAGWIVAMLLLGASGIGFYLYKKNKNFKTKVDKIIKK